MVGIEDRQRKNNNSRIPEEGKQCNCTEQIHEVTSRLHHINNCYGKEPLMKAKLVNWKYHEKQEMSNLKVSLHNMFINYGGNTSNFTVEKPGRCHLNQVSKASITSNRPHERHVCSGGRHREAHTINSMLLLLKLYHLLLIMNRCQTQLKDILQKQRTL